MEFGPPIYGVGNRFVSFTKVCDKHSAEFPFFKTKKPRVYVYNLVKFSLSLCVSLSFSLSHTHSLFFFSLSVYIIYINIEKYYIVLVDKFKIQYNNML